VGILDGHAHRPSTPWRKQNAHLVQNRRVCECPQNYRERGSRFHLHARRVACHSETFQVLAFTQWEPQACASSLRDSLQDAWRGRPQIAEFPGHTRRKDVGVRADCADETPYTGRISDGPVWSQSVSEHGSVRSGPPEDTLRGPSSLDPQSFVLATGSRIAASPTWSRCSASVPALAPDWEQSRLPQGIRIEMAPLDKTRRNCM